MGVADLQEFMMGIVFGVRGGGQEEVDKIWMCYNRRGRRRAVSMWCGGIEALSNIPTLTNRPPILWFLFVAIGWLIGIHCVESELDWRKMR